jgi:hypothetical protein
MRMLGTCINVQIADELVTKTGFGEHSFDGPAHQFSGPLCEDLLGSRETLSTRITGVTNVNAIVHLVTLEGNLLGVDDDDVVTAIHVRSVARFGLAAEDKSNPGCKTAKRKIRGIDDDPLFLYSSLVKGDCFVAKCVHCLDL